MYLKTHPKETHANKERLTKIMERWTRSLLEMPESYKHVSDPVSANLHSSCP